MKNDIQTLAETWIKTKSNRDFKKLYDRLKPGLWHQLESFEKDFDARNDIINIVFGKAIANINQYSSEKGKFSTWIYQINRNEALASKNVRQRLTSLDELEELGFAPKEEGHEAEVESFDLKFGRDREAVFSELYNKTIKAFSECKDKQIADAFLKWHFEQKSYEQIGQELGICTNTAKQKIYRGKKLVRDALLKSDGDLVECYREQL